MRDLCKCVRHQRRRFIKHESQGEQENIEHFFRNFNSILPLNILSKALLNLLIFSLQALKLLVDFLNFLSLPFAIITQYVSKHKANDEYSNDHVDISDVKSSILLSHAKQLSCLRRSIVFYFIVFNSQRLAIKSVLRKRTLFYILISKLCELIRLTF